MYIIYVYDHNNEEWVFSECFGDFLIAALSAGYLAYDGYDVSLVNVNTSEFEYFWSL